MHQVTTLHVVMVIQVTRKFAHDEQSPHEHDNVDSIVTSEHMYDGPIITQVEGVYSSPGSSSGGLINGNAHVVLDANVVETVQILHGHMDESKKQYKNIKKLKRKMLLLFGSPWRKGSESSMIGESDAIKKVWYEECIALRNKQYIDIRSIKYCILLFKSCEVA